ncbi:MAG: hypothetical protein GY835_01535 [bacterium]|nr:hypothetical protein [bacterium]
MITNHILEEKWRVQRLLSKQAGHDPGKYIELVHRKAMEAQERYGVQFKYVQMEENSAAKSGTKES